MGYKIEELKPIRELLRGTLGVLEPLLERKEGRKVTEGEVALVFGELSHKAIQNYFWAKRQAEYQERKAEKRKQGGMTTEGR